MQTLQVASFLTGSLNYDPDVMCSHHGEGHGEGHNAADMVIMAKDMAAVIMAAINKKLAVEMRHLHGIFS